MTPALRAAVPGDATEVATLLDALGHPAPVDEVCARLERAAGRDRTGALVADAGHGAVALAAWDTYEQLHRPWPVCRITTVVVHEEQRRQGLARALLAEIERLALGDGCGRLEVITAHGEQAQRFYRALGFEESPVRFVKGLAPAQPGWSRGHQ